MQKQIQSILKLFKLTQRGLSKMSYIQEIPEIEQYWDSFSDEYSSQDDATNIFYLSLLNMLKVNTRKQILEVGAGAGFLYNHTMNYKRPEAYYTATDLSEKMLSILCKRLKIQEGFKDSLFVEKYNLKVEKANGEQLQYNDNTFDCYIANLCLQITTNPEKMIAEAYRVLQKGGVVGFTVWGEKAKSYYFNIVPEVLAKYGIQPPTSRTMFHLNDREKLIKMLEDAGFTNVICWNQFSPFHHQTEEEFNRLLNYPRNLEAFALAGDKKDEVRQECLKRMMDHIQTNKLPLGLDGLIITATKN